MSIRTASFAANCSISFKVETGPVYAALDTDSYQSHISHIDSSNYTLAIYSWDFNALYTDYEDILMEISDSTIVGVQVGFWHENLTDVPALEILYYNGTVPVCTSTNSVIATRITSVVLGETVVANTSKAFVTVDLEDETVPTSTFFARMGAFVSAPGTATLIIRRHSD